MAVTLRQVERGAADREADLKREVHAMNARLCGLFLSRPWAVQLLATNLETGLPEEPPHETWDRMAAGMDLSHAQAETFGLMDVWWRRQAAALVEERRAAAAAALAAPTDLEAQAAALEGLERIQASYLVLAIAANTVVFWIMTPRQNAEMYVSSWPYLPTLLSVLQACAKPPPTGSCGD
ncbi:MAG: hypothetical protein J3K34DRAFT_442539 [Monoraphidium minutum]|nr:MAG: hypothetical protein J3K34DRAFT_442539 [Monoraphidium minutum]